MGTPLVFHYICLIAFDASQQRQRARFAGLAGEENIQSTHLAKVVQYRPKGMMV